MSLFLVSVNSNEAYFYDYLLLNIPYMGPVAIVRAIEAYGSAQAFYEDCLRSSHPPDVIKQKQFVELKSFKSFKKLELELQEMNRQSVHLLQFQEKNYPRKLRQIHAYPPLIMMKGDMQKILYNKYLAVVGSRDISDYGERVCEYLIKNLSQHKLSIISGFARGVDIKSHMASISYGLQSIAVMGCGLRYIHPASHHRYIDRFLSKGGYLLSEFSYNTAPAAGLFPRRNRIISALSDGVLIIEAAKKSGAMITARYALEHNKDLFVVPGSIFSKNSEGALSLIKEGAKLVNSAQDILEEWEMRESIPEKTSLSFENPDEEKIYLFCLQTDKHRDEICEDSGLTAEKVCVLLTQLELKGRIESRPGAYYRSIQ